MLAIRHPLPPGIPGQIERLRDWLALPPSQRGDGAGANAVLGEIAESHARLTASLEDCLALLAELCDSVEVETDRESLDGAREFVGRVADRIGRAREVLLRAKGG